MIVSHYAVIILAAGFSSRMGIFKPNYKLDGKTITQRLIDCYLAQNIAVFLVVGWQKAELLAATNHTGITIVDNPDFAQGMFSSVKCGLEAVSSHGARAVFIQPVDIPLIRPATLDILLHAAQKAPARIYYPCFNSRRGHPVLIAANLIPDILAWNGEGGLKGCLSTYPDLARELPVTDSNILFDIDIPQDLAELKERYARMNSPEG